MEDKTLVLKIFKHHILGQKDYDFKLKPIRTDNDTEFKNLAFGT